MKLQKTCPFCKANINHINYKDTDMLRKHLSSFGRIVARKRSGMCVWHQRKLAVAIKRSRFMALLPYLVQ